MKGLPRVRPYGILGAAVILKALAYQQVLPEWMGPACMLAGWALWWRGVSFFRWPRQWVVGWASATLSVLLMLSWLPATIFHYSTTPVPVAWGVILLLSMYLALYDAIPLFFVRQLPFSVGRVFGLGMVLWGAYVLRAWLITGFPWGEAAAAMTPWPVAIQAADLLGTHGLSAVVALVAFLVGWPEGSMRRRMVLGAGLVFLLLGYGKARLQSPRLNGRGAIHVRLVQPSIPMEEKLGLSVGEGFDRQLRLSRLPVNQQVDLVIWPESSLPVVLTPGSQWWVRLRELQRWNRTYLLVGTDRWIPDRPPRLYNSGVLIDPQGRPAGVYDKVHLVPFGEYVPLRRWLYFVDRLVGGMQDFSRGQGHRVIVVRGKDLKLGVMICFESIFPGPSVEYARQGADFLVVLTNDAWFDASAGPGQHWMHTVLRAVETRRPLVFTANTGPSAAVDARGKRLGAMALNTVGVLDVALPRVRIGTTVYVRIGPVLDRVMVVGSLLLSFGGCLLKRRQARHKTRGP